MDGLIKGFLVLVVVFGLLLGGMYALDKANCLAKTQGMGYSADYTAFGGCRIEVKSGHWIPLDSYYFKEE